MRGIFAGGTDYSHQSFNDMITDLKQWIDTLELTIKNIDIAMKYIEDNNYKQSIDYSFLCTYYYSHKFFNTCIEELKSIVVGMKNEVKESHVNRLNAIGQKGKELSNDFGRVWNSDSNTEDYGNPCFDRVEILYSEARDMCNDLIDICNLSYRLKDFIGEGIRTLSRADMSTVLEGIWILESETMLTQGTAFMLKDLGVITCEHVLAKETYAFHSSDITKKYPIKVLKSNKHLDLALISIEGCDNGFTTLIRGDSDVLNQMDDIFVAGFPNYRLGDTGTINPGIVTGFRSVSGIRRILTNAPIVAGNSGGPVFNSKGEVIGVAITGADCIEEAANTEFHSIVPIKAIKFL